jgi:hypothetical protein
MDKRTSLSVFSYAILGMYATGSGSARLTTKSNPYWAARLTIAALRTQVVSSSYPSTYSLLSPDRTITAPTLVDEAATFLAHMEKPLICDLGDVAGNVLTIRCQQRLKDDAERARVSFAESKINNLLDVIQRGYEFRGANPVLQVDAASETLIVPFDALALWWRDYDVGHSLSLLERGVRLVGGADAAIELRPPKRMETNVPPPRLDGPSD